jgi:two-component system sensor histidine kinase HupT/HoxJ
MASLGRMVAGVAHELNNPISFIYSNMYALQRYEKRFQEYLNIVHQNLAVDVREKARQKLRIDSLLADIHPLIEASIEGAERVSKIVQNLGRYAASKQDNFTILNLSKLIENALRWVIRSVSNKPQLRLDLPEELIISNSEGHLHQIFINLLQNALDALEDNLNPVIEIYAKKDKDKAVVTVRDNGQGIDEDKLLCVFDPFFTTKPVGKGTGLGLYISYGLATNQCGGSLEVVNHAAGGAIFTLRLPLQNREEHHV